MQDIVIDKPYRFFAPCSSRLWPAMLRLYLPHYLKKQYGVTRVECQGLEHIQGSLAAGDGVLLAPNHCRDCDPMVLGQVSSVMGRNLFVMASWHLFMQGKWTAWLIQRAGAFSVYREGMDRAAVSAATDILERAERPLVIFPEGVVSRTNDYLNPLMEGTALIARAAAKKRAKSNPPGKVVVHPVAIRYHAQGDIEAPLSSYLEELEKRMGWRAQKQLPLVDRVYKIGHGLLCLKEVEAFGHEQLGALRERLDRLINHLLAPLEAQWLKGAGDGGVVARVKRLRAAILPDMIQGEIPEAERDRRWRQLSDLYLAQQLDHYPENYLRSNPTAERLLETVERFEEDLTDISTPHVFLNATVHIGSAIEVSPVREDKESSGLMRTVEQRLKRMLGIDS